MSGHYTQHRSNAEKLSNCIQYITGSGGFHSFGQFLSTLLDDLPNLDQVVIQTVSHFFGEEHLQQFLKKVAGHRLVKSKGDLQSLVPSYGFHPSEHRQEGMSAIQSDTCHAVLTYYIIGANDSPLRGQGILLRWALDLILEEVDKEATALAKPHSSFHPPNDWTWDSLNTLSLHIQHNVATQQGPIIWSVLTTIAVSKERRKTIQKEEEGDKRDPWQAS